MNKLLTDLILSLAACSTSAPAPASPARAPLAPNPDTAAIRARIDQLHRDTADVAARLDALHDALAQRPAKHPRAHAAPPVTDPDPHPGTITVDPSCPLCR